MFSSLKMEVLTTEYVHYFYSEESMHYNSS